MHLVIIPVKTAAKGIVSEVHKRVVFQKGSSGGTKPRNETPERNPGTRVHSDVPPERKQERGYIRMFPRNENKNEGTFAQNHPSTKPPFCLLYR